MSKIPSSIFNLANLTELERRVMHFIEKEPKLASEIQREVQIPRATLDRVLNSLHTRSFLKRKKLSKKRTGWVAVNADELLSKYGLPKYSAGNHDQAINKKLETAGVRVFVGKREMFAVTKRFISTHAGERVKVMQTNNIWELWQHNLSKEENMEIHSLLKQKTIINEGIFSEEILEKKQPMFFDSYSERPSVIHELPSKYSSFYSDVTVSRKAVYLMNWKDEIGIEIQNEDIKKMFNMIFTFIENNTVASSVYERSH